MFLKIRTIGDKIVFINPDNIESLEEELTPIKLLTKINMISGKSYLVYRFIAEIRSCIEFDKSRKIYDEGK